MINSIIVSIFLKVIRAHEEKYAEVAGRMDVNISCAKKISFYDRSDLDVIILKNKTKEIQELREQYQYINTDRNTIIAFCHSTQLFLDTKHSVFSRYPYLLLPNVLLTRLKHRIPLFTVREKELKKEFLAKYYTANIQAILIKYILILK